jgi:hypothetical protein
VLAHVGHRLLRGAHAGEPHRAGGDHTLAFRRYEERFVGYAKVAKRGSAGPFLAPGTPRKIRMRNWTFKYAVLLKAMMKLTDKFATDIDLPDYGLR